MVTRKIGTGKCKGLTGSKLNSCMKRNSTKTKSASKVKKYKRVYGGRLARNPDISVTPMMGGKFNVHNEVSDYSIGDYNSSQLVKLGFSKPDIRAVSRTGTVNFVKVKKIHENRLK